MKWSFKDWKPIDFISIAVLIIFTILKLNRINHITDYFALAIISFYYGYRLEKLEK